MFILAFILMQFDSDQEIVIKIDSSGYVVEGLLL